MLKNPKGSPFQFFGIVRLFFLLFSLQRVPFILFDILQQNGCLKPKGPPFLFFVIVRLFFPNFFSPKGPPFNCDKNVDNFGSVPLLARQSVHFFGFSIFEYCKLTPGSPFAIFEPWIWRRLGPVPACLLKIISLQVVFCVAFA